MKTSGEKISDNFVVVMMSRIERRHYKNVTMFVLTQQEFRCVGSRGSGDYHHESSIWQYSDSDDYSR